VVDTSPAVVTLVALVVDALTVTAGTEALASSVPLFFLHPLVDGALAFPVASLPFLVEFLPFLQLF